MPDHLHAILSFPPDKIIRKTVSNWKRYNARFHGIQWQSDFFEHRLRDETSFREKFDYIQRNPSRNGLCEHLTDWPHYIETSQLER